jgi:phosphatidylinositol alpha-1,6-mannosyltransferase
MNAKHLLLSEIFPPKTGGSGRWFWDLYSRLNEGDIIVLTDFVEGRGESENLSGLMVYRTRMNSKSWSVKTLGGLRFYFSMVRQVIRLVKKYKIQSIHCGRTLPEGIIGLITKLFTGTPYICYVHGEDIEMCKSSREFSFLLNMVLKKASLLICNSKNSKKLLMQWKEADESRVRILHPGVDASVFSPNNNKVVYDFLPEKKIILTVSRLQPRKGHDVMITAMQEIIKVHSDIHYIIIGSGERESFLNELIIEKNLSNHITLLGECSDEEILEWYRRSDLFVLPNRQVGTDVEGFGIVLLEAQACSTPVIAGDSGGTSETMIANTTGYILDCTNSHALETTVIELFSNTNQLIEIGEKGRNWVLAMFDWPIILGSAQSIFSEINIKNIR